MIIDAHTHLALADAKVNELITSMQKAKIDKALVFAGGIDSYSTEQLLQDIAPYQGKLYAIGSVSPLSSERPSLQQVEDWLATKQIHGLKFYPGYQYFYPADAALRLYLELLVKYNRPAIFHSGDTYSGNAGAKLKYAQAIHIDDLATELPELKIVVAHFGYPWVTEAAEVCYKNKNVYVDCSGFVYGAFTADQQAHFRDIIKEFERISNARDRIIFGTDWPISEQASYVQTARIIFGEDFVKFYSSNAIELFGIE